MHASTTTATSASAVRSGTASPRRWRVVDIVVASVIGVAFGVVYWAWGAGWELISTPLSLILPGSQALLAGVWLMAGVVGGLIVRKPGAALYTELLAAVVSALIGSQWGWLTLEAGLVQGLGAELVLLAVLYRRSGPVVAVLAGAAAGLAMGINDLVIYYTGLGADFMAVYLVAGVIGGAVIAGLGGWLLVRALVPTGVLARFPAGRTPAAG